MKKLVMSLVLATAMSTSVYAIDLCEVNPNLFGCNEGIPGPVGPEGPQGIPGIDGIDGIDGVDGVDGEQGVQGEQGETGPAGADGKDGKDGENGTDGTDGVDGFNGTNGSDGVTTNIVSVDADYEYQKAEFLKRFTEVEEYSLDSDAGQTAMASIDFGTTGEGVTEVGIGIGYASSTFGSSTAGALGVKHGITATEAVIVKGWTTGSNNYGVGGAVTTKF